MPDANILPQSFHPSLKLLIARGNLSELFQENAAVWHKNCKGKLTVTKFERYTKKRKSDETPCPIEIKKTRSKVDKFDKEKCFIPGCIVTETTEEDPLHEVIPKELDARFREYATFMNDTDLLTKLAGGDLERTGNVF